MQEFVKNIDMSNFDDNDVLLIVFNSLPYNRREIIEAWINTPRDKQYSYLIAPPDGLQIYDAQGKALDTQWEGVEDESYPVAEMHARAFPFYCRRHRVFFDTEDIPAGGYKIFKVSSIDYENTSDTEWTDSISRTSTILKGPYTLENEYLHLEINPNGTFDLIDKRSGRKFEQLNYYLNSGEQGNYWVNKKPMFNKTYSSRGCSAEIWSEENGPLQATLASRITLSLPEHISKAGSKRSNATVEMKITTKVTLRKGQDFVEVGVNFENRHKDHYLKVMFPTGISKAEYTWSGGHFTVDKRAIRPQGPTEKTVWPDMGTLPQNNFIDINDGNYGLAFINDSFTEYEVIDNEERTVAFSLLRSVKNWICTERIGSDYPSQKQGQCLGEYNYRYAIKPHTGSCFDADIPTASMCFNIPLQPVQTRRHQGRLPQNMCKLFEIENRALQFSALKKAEDRDTFVLRLYNPAESEQDSIISFNRRVEKVWLANLNEKRIKELSVAKNGCVSIVADPQKILTIEFSVDN
jgi:mannosylglycerate hydrolase